MTAAKSAKSNRSMVRKSANKTTKKTQVVRRTENIVKAVSTDEKIQILLQNMERLESTTTFNPGFTLNIAAMQTERTKNQNTAIDNIFDRFIVNAFPSPKNNKIRKIKIQPKKPIQRTLFQFNYTRVCQPKITRYFFGFNTQ
jgi:hypothetical protein